MTVNEEGVGNITRDDRGIVHVHIIDIIHNIDALALTRIRRLDYPYIFLRVVLLQLLIVSIKVSELVRQDIGVWDKVKVALAKLFLHPHHVVA